MNSALPTDPTELVRHARGGNGEALGQLLARYGNYLSLLARVQVGRRLQGKIDAADLVQETFLAVLRPSASHRAGGYDASKGAIGNYLFGIARHFVLKRLSAREVATFDLDEHDEETAWPDGRPSVLDGLTRAETIQAVRAAIASLPAVYREAVVLCELQELSYADAAAIAQCPVGTVRSRLHRAKAMLTTKLSTTHRGADCVRSATR